MRSAFTRPNVWLTLCGVVFILAGCDRSKSDEARETGAVTTANQGKVPVTTGSEEARQLQAEGLRLADQLRPHEAGQLFEKAVAKDPNFAMAHFNLAQASPNAKETTEHLNRAVALSDKASEGERLTILAFQAINNGDPAKWLEYSKQLVAAYPEDERAHAALGNVYFFGEQDYEGARDELQKAIDVEPNFAPAYNMLGYSHSALGDYPEAETAFKKYIELVPNDPNPYDSYAELLLRTGKFDESIKQYQKALSIDPHFVASHFGIAANHMYQGKHNQALAEADKLDKAGQNDADRRLGLLTKALVYVDQGKNDAALKEIQKRYELAAKIGDTVTMAGDVETMGDILLHAGRPDEAAKRYEQASSLVAKSSRSQEAKDDAALAHHYNLGRVALAKKDLAAAKTHAAAYLDGAKAKDSEFRTREAHKLAGKIAKAEKNYDQAIAELAQANQLDPSVLYATGSAYEGKGDQAKAAEFRRQATELYTLPTLNHAFVRAKARKAAAGA
ncbi:MAG TPA: tetratricopeptide repeat protein [Gemmatimonadales bacterium]|nr:tetratricopeptide repeat protein [Gemmatimonadales bacterium]